MSDINLGDKFKFPTPQNMESSEPILIVDDQQDLRLIVMHHLQKLTYTSVYQAANGMDALEVLAKLKKPAIILSDNEMPVMGGLELLQELREKPEIPRGPFCLAMDNVNKEKLMLAVEVGVDEMLVKPYTQGDIIPKLRSAFKIFNNTKNPERVYEFAKAHYREGRLEEAGKVYQILSVAAPKAARPEVGLARVAMGKGQFDEALKHLTNAEARNPNYVHLYSVRGDVHAKRSEWDLAIASFQKAIALSPLNPIRYQSAADILFKVNRFQDAITLLNLAVQYKLEFPSLHNYLSQAHFSLKDYTSALKSIKAALSQAPDNVIYLNQLGICHKESGDFEEAAKTYNKVIKLDPDNVAALYNKAIMLHAKGENAEAIRLLERLVKKQPDFQPGKQKLEEYKKESPPAKAS